MTPTALTIIGIILWIGLPIFLEFNLKEKTKEKLIPLLIIWVFGFWFGYVFLIKYLVGT